MIKYLGVIAEYRTAPEEAVPSAEPGAEFLRRACLTYSSADGTLQRTAAAVLAEHPDLGRDDVWVAAARADAEAVGRLLHRDARLAVRPGGPHRWPPIGYLAYARHDPNLSHLLGPLFIAVGGLSGHRAPPAPPLGRAPGSDHSALHQAVATSSARSSWPGSAGIETASPGTVAYLAGQTWPPPGVPELGAPAASVAAQLSSRTIGHRGSSPNLTRPWSPMLTGCGLDW